MVAAGCLTGSALPLAARDRRRDRAWRRARRVNGVVIVRSGLHSFIITLASDEHLLRRDDAHHPTHRPFRAHAAEIRRIRPDALCRLSSRRCSLSRVGVGAAAGLLSIGYTALGREMLAAGAKPAAAELSGVRVGRAIRHLPLPCPAASPASPALMVVARNGAAIPSMAGQLGQDWLLPAFLGAGARRHAAERRRASRCSAPCSARLLVDDAHQRASASCRSANSGSRRLSASLLLLAVLLDPGAALATSRAGGTVR